MIKQRLFWSNVLMIVIPLLLSLMLTAIAVNLVLDHLGFATTSYADTKLFYQTAKQAQRSVNRWQEADEIQLILADMQKWGIPSKSGSVSLFIYNDNKPVYRSADFLSTPLLDIAIAQPEHDHFMMDHVAVFSIPVGQYQVYLQNTNHEIEEMEFIDESNRGFFVGIGLISLIIFVILATNRILTQLIFKGIITPLDILVDGVHEIQDGNLDYRINYNKKDEFQPICSDFNQMASKIQELMAVKKKDDENRRELIAGISHDLRTPLTAIIAYVEGLTSGIISDSVMQKEYLETIASKAKDLEHIVGQLFQYAKLDIDDFPFSLRYFDIGEELTRYVNDITKEYQRRGLHITLQSTPKDVFVNVDAVQLRNVFTNLLENSLKYGHKSNKLARIKCQLHQDQVEIAFTDNGPGVPDDKLERLFNAFYRTDKARHNPGQGSGLGLAISYRIVQRMGGTMQAQNASGCGLHIVVTLPAILGGDLDEKNTNY